MVDHDENGGVYEDSRQQAHTINQTNQNNHLSIVISSQSDDQLEQEMEMAESSQRAPIWQDLVRDEFSLIKCKQNAFGSKGYNLEMDKSALA